MKLYIYEIDTKQIVKIVEGATNEECENQAFNYLGVDEFGATYTPVLAPVDGLIPMTTLFYRLNIDGNAEIFDDDGVCTRLDENVYPIGSELSARYEHPNGIVLTVADAKMLNIKIEGE